MRWHLCVSFSDFHKKPGTETVRQQQVSSLLLLRQFVNGMGQGQY